MLNGGAIAITVWVFGGMVEQACYMNRAQSLYWFFASLVVALLAAQFGAWGRPAGEGTPRHRRLCHRSAGALVLAALALFTAGGLTFLHALSHNEIVACADDTDGDNVQTYGT
ncbi:MAG: hypothetical protein WDN72_04175 [Alphaproteobacteria bacterium]